ncbi:MAG: hypothetical protein JST00_30400 [Deltaproteobacteria bacterium]|nr:hypothetical protein [Deltaproteobacteria bacterium]
MQNRVFFPQLAVDEWGIEGKIDLTGNEIIVLADGRRYKVEEAVRIVAEVTGANEEQKLVGKVKPKRALDEIGAEILENSMILGDNAYDIVPGWMATPSSPFADHLLSPERMKAREGRTDIGTGPHTDEELLERFLEGTL